MQMNIACSGADCGNHDTQTTTKKKSTDLAFGLYNDADLYEALQMTINCGGPDCGNHDTQTTTTTKKTSIFGLAQNPYDLQMTINCDGADCGNHDTQTTTTTTTRKGIFYELP